MFEKVTMITLLYLTTLGEVKMESFEIVSKESCSSWFHQNVKVQKQKKRKLFSSHVYHMYEGKQVIGYICGDDPPQ